jgi:hypothetical protein
MVTQYEQVNNSKSQRAIEKNKKGGFKNSDKNEEPH